MSDSPRFLNVDVDVRCAAGGLPLLNYLRNRSVLLSEEDGGFSFEAIEQHEDVEGCVAALVALVQGLPTSLLTAWNACEDRIFDVGFEAPSGKHSVVVELLPSTVRAISDVGAKLRVTIYQTRSQP